MHGGGLRLGGSGTNTRPVMAKAPMFWIAYFYGIPVVVTSPLIPHPAVVVTLGWALTWPSLQEWGTGNREPPRVGLGET